MSTNNETNVHPSQPAAPRMRPLAVQARGRPCSRCAPGRFPFGISGRRTPGRRRAGRRMPGRGPKGRPAAPIGDFPGAVRVTGWPERRWPPKSARTP